MLLMHVWRGGLYQNPNGEPFYWVVGGDGVYLRVVALDTNISPYIISIWCMHLLGLCKLGMFLALCLLSSKTKKNKKRGAMGGWVADSS